MSRLDDGFKRPKEHIPRENLPKPPRQQLMDQLGLQEDDCNSKTSSESEDEEKVPNLSTPSTPSRVKGSNEEVEELRVILRETQRKLFMANSSLTDSTNSKEKKLKIMKSSHTTAMALKDQLIQDLQDIIQERDDRITQLEAGVVIVNPVASQEGGLTKLLERIAQLHKENVVLHTRCEEVGEELKAMKAEKVRLEDELIMSKDVPVKIPLSASSQTTKHIKELTHKIRELEKGGSGAVHTGGTEAEKELAIQVAGLQAQLAALQGELRDLSEKYKVSTDALPQVKAENTRLKAEVGKLTSDVQALRSNESQLLMKAEALDKTAKEKSLYAADVTSEKERLLSELSTLKDKVVGLQAQLAAVQGELRDLSEKYKVNTDALPQVKAENTRLKAEVGKLTSDVQALRSNESQLLMKAEALDKTAKEKYLYAADVTSEKERLLSELSTLKAKMATLEDAHHVTLVVFKAAETREKAAVEECSSLREQITSLQGQLDGDTKRLQSKTSQLQRALEESSSRCTLLESQLMEAEAKMSKAVSTAVEQGRALTAGTNERLAIARVGLSRVHCSAVGAVEAFAALRRLAQTSLVTFNNDICTACQKICHKISGISATNRLLTTKYRKEMQLRKKLHNELVELRGNIRVFCRVRPAISEDGEGTQASVVVQPDRDDDGVVRVITKGTWKVFELDKVFGPMSTQMEVFSEVRDLVISCMDGYSVCIFAYGQTGSGKTFTMEGTADNPGINQRALLELFRITEERCDDWEYSVVVSVLEIYNEMVRDLLSHQHTDKMEIKQGPEGNYVPGLTQVQVTCLQELNEVFAIGHDNRATGSTKMNIQSSRSHALLCVTVHGKCKTTGIEIFGKLNLIDLAGSERVDKSGSDGIRLQEAKHINKSLSALGDVIHSLKSKSQHIPYRNSKLTYLLQDSLSGDSKTLMVVQISPVEKNGLETVCSLNFAQRVKAVELGQAGKKVVEAFTEKVV